MEENGKRHVRVEEPSICTVGEASEVLVNSILLILWTRKLLDFSMSITAFSGVGGT
jgi:hypothetical protein